MGYKLFGLFISFIITMQVITVVTDSSCRNSCTCEPQDDISCPVPMEISNGTFLPKMPRYENGSRITYKCDNTYVPNTILLTRTCVYGCWKPEIRIRCRRPFFSYCNPPINLLTGMYFEPTKQFYLPGQHVTFSCPDGYMINGEDSAICMATHTWTQFPTCNKFCRPRSPPRYGGQIPPEEFMTGNPGEIVTYFCDDYCTLNGFVSSTCNDDGSWSEEVPVCICPSCVDRCTSESVTDVPCQCYAGCNPLQDNCCPGHSICQFNGSSCPPLSTVSNGSLNVHGNVATYTCDDGYQLCGNEQRICDEGQWSGAHPRCLTPQLSCMDRCGHLAIFPEECDCDGECSNYFSCCCDYSQTCAK